MSEMQAYLYHGNRDLRLASLERPRALANQVLVKITDAGLSQTQVNEFAEGPFFINQEPHPRTHIGMPLIPCQEFGGEVVELGENVDTQWLGKQVAVLPLESCGECPQCQQGNTHLCPTLTYKGVIGAHGGFSQYMAVEESLLFEVERRDQLTYVEPLLVGVHAWLRLQHLVNPDTTNVLIIGAGALGIAAAVVWQEIVGVRNVRLFDRLPERLARCQAMGLNIVTGVDDQQQAYDVVIDLGGKDPLAEEQALEIANNLCRPQGTVVIMGSYFSPISMIPMNQMVTEKSWIPSFAYNADDVDFLHTHIDKIRTSFEPTIDRIAMNDLIEKGYYEAELDKSRFIRLVCMPHE